MQTIESGERLELTPQSFGNAFKQFLEVVIDNAEPPRNPILDQVRVHLDEDPAKLAVLTEEFDGFEQPNVQVALNAALSVPHRASAPLGIAVDQRQGSNLRLSELISTRTGPWRSAANEGPVEYVNYRLA